MAKNPSWTADQILDVKTSADGPEGLIPLTEEELRHGHSGDIFGKGQGAAMLGGGDKLVELGSGNNDFLIVSTQGGLRGPNGENIASGLHIGHWELGMVAEAAARTFKEGHAHPHAVQVSDPCDGRTQGTPGMMDSLAYRNSAATTMGNLMRSTPTRKGVMGIATCDKGVPATMMALAGEHDLPTIFVPGGVSLPTKPTPHLGPDYEHGVNAANGQSIIGAFAEGKIDLQQAQEIGCKACGTPGGGCQFLGTAATSQVVAEAMGMSLPHSALTPSGQPIWLDMGERSAEALMQMSRKHTTTKEILTDDAIHNAMVVHAAFGGSTNLLLHIPAIAHAAGLKQPTREDWEKINKETPRLVDVLPNHKIYTTVHAFMAGGVPEVMLQLREYAKEHAELDLLRLNAKTVTGKTLDENLNEWKQSTRRTALREKLKAQDGIDPEDVIYSPDRAKAKGLTSTVIFPEGNLAPEGSVIKSTAIAPELVGKDPFDPEKEGVKGVYHKIGKARVFAKEDDAMDAIKGTNPAIPKIEPGQVMVLVGLGPVGMGMPETFAVTRALRYSEIGKHVPLLTDGRFSGVSTGACIGHIGPEALAGGPLGKLKDGDIIEIKIDTNSNALKGGINFVGTELEHRVSPEKGAEILARRPMNSSIKQHPDLPADVRIWAAEQAVCGGTWGGCVRDAATIENLLSLGTAAQQQQNAAAGPLRRVGSARH